VSLLAALAALGPESSGSLLLVSGQGASASTRVSMEARSSRLTKHERDAEEVALEVYAQMRINGLGGVTR
jgi:nicotinamide riboside kinase